MVRLSEVAHCEAPAGLQHPRQLRKGAGEVVGVPDCEPRDRVVEGLLPEREILEDRLDRVRVAGRLQHGAGRVEEDRGPSHPGDRLRHRPWPRPEVEHQVPPAHGERDGFAPHPPVDVEGDPAGRLLVGRDNLLEGVDHVGPLVLQAGPPSLHGSPPPAGSIKTVVPEAGRLVAA